MKYEYTNNMCYTKFTAIFRKIVIILSSRNTPNNKFVNVTEAATQRCSL